MGCLTEVNVANKNARSNANKVKPSAKNWGGKFQYAVKKFYPTLDRYIVAIKGFLISERKIERIDGVEKMRVNVKTRRVGVYTSEFKRYAIFVSWFT